jgi:GAF domain-containing protein
MATADDDVQDITERVNATAHASVRLDDLIMKRLDDRLNPSDYVSGEVDFAVAAQQLVQVAVEAVGANAGACYLVDHARRCFDREASVIGNQRLAKLWEYPRMLDADAQVLGVISNDEHQTLQLPPGSPKNPAIEPTCRARPGAPYLDSLELATPLPGPLASPQAPAIGVLTVAKLAAPLTPYGAHELAVLRNGALRLALIATTTNTTRAARMFFRISSRGGRTTPVPTSAAVAAESRSDTPPLVLPDDIRTAFPALHDALTTIAEVTRSHSATFRASLPDPSCTAPHGTALVRVAAYPQALLEATTLRSQRHEEGGVNWRVALTGSLENVPDVAKLEGKDYRRHRPNTKSELCVPVYVEDRVVGVMNLESPVAHAYDAHVDIAQATAEHVGLAIANARLALASVLQEHAIEVIRRAHHLTHKPEDLKRLAARVPRDVAGELAAIAASLDAETATLRRAPAPDLDLLPAECDTTLPGLVRVAVEAAELSFCEIRVDGSEWAPHPPDVAGPVLKALADILHNAREHRARGAELVILHCRHGTWGGSADDVLELRATPDVVLNPEIAINVYRCPLQFGFDETDDSLAEPRLGAYLAGLHLRRVGGDAHLCYTSGHDVRCTVSLPAPPVPQHHVERATEGETVKTVGVDRA